MSVVYCAISDGLKGIAPIDVASTFVPVAVLTDSHVSSVLCHQWWLQRHHPNRRCFSTCTCCSHLGPSLEITATVDYLVYFTQHVNVHISVTEWTCSPKKQLVSTAHLTSSWLTCHWIVRLLCKNFLCDFTLFTCNTRPKWRPGMSGVTLLSGISGLSFFIPFLSPLFSST